MPEGQVWYGNDGNEESIRPFGPTARAELLAHYERVGHEPYDRDRQGVTSPEIPEAPRREGLMDWLRRLIQEKSSKEKD